LTRAILIANLRKLYRVDNDSALMDVLQDVGSVSSEAVMIGDVPDGDLVRAWNRANV
jgi:hypothetical protein